MMTSSIIAFSVLGFFCSVFYDFFYLLEKLFSNKKAAFVLDVIFSVLCGFLSLIFVMAYNDGNVRAVFFVAFFICFYLYRFTFGRFASAFTVKLSKSLKNIFKKVAFCLEKVKKRLQMYGKKVYNKTIGKKRKSGFTKEKRDEKSVRGIPS